VELRVLWERCAGAVLGPGGFGAPQNAAAKKTG